MLRFKKLSVVNGEVKIRINLDRFSKQFQRAQYVLDGQVMNSMIPFMPMITGQFIDVTRSASAAIQGSGRVYAGVGPQARYLYEGKVMVDSKTMKGPYKISTGPGEYVLRFRKGSKLIATKRPLNYSKTAHPQATDHWFNPAKKKDKRKWIKMVKSIAGGKHG